MKGATPKTKRSQLHLLHQLYSCRVAEIDALLKYIESNQSQSDKRFVDVEIYTRLADVTTKILQSDR